MNPEEFLTDQAALAERVTGIDPRAYERTRNFLDGSVTRLSPFFTHGILDPVRTLEKVTIQHGASDCFKLISEFSWREYFQRIWQAKQHDIFTDLKRPQAPLTSSNIPTALIKADTGIQVMDEAIRGLYETGMMHNHARMWLAGITCNIGQTHWLTPSQWLYYHLLDGDLASNSLSWQWCAGTFSSKKYIANQENLNKYSKRTQQNTFIDTDYASLAQLPPPPSFQEREPFDLRNDYPSSTLTRLDPEKHLLLYSLWNLDPTWESEPSRDTHQRVLLIEPSLYDRYPMSPLRWKFILHWASQIPQLEIFVGELPELTPSNFNSSITYREHPLTQHWPGEAGPRSWIHPHTSGYYPSFSAYWKAIKKNRPDPT